MNIYSPTISGSLTISGSILTTGGGLPLTGSLVSSGSFTSIGNTTITGSLLVSGSITTNSTITAQTLVVQTITSSVSVITGSTNFGSLLTNTHVFSGSVYMNPGGLFVSSSGNIGVNTITPNLTNSGVAITLLGSSTDRGNLELGSTTASTTGVFGQIAGYNGATLANLIQFAGDGATDSGYIKFFTKATGGSITERIRITSTGVLSIGSTGKSWGTSYKAIDLGAAWGMMASGTNEDGYICSNTYYNGSNWIVSNSASLKPSVVRIYDGFLFRSGTTAAVGGTTTLSDLMVITSAGNVGINTSTPVSLGANYTTLEIKGQSGLYGGAIQLTSADGTNKGRVYTANDTFWVGTSNSLPLGFITADTERMRITSGGKLCVGRTATIFTSSGHVIQADVSSGGEPVLEVYNQNLSDSAPAIACFKNSATTSSSARFIQFYSNAGSQAMGGIVGNGATNVQFASISDIREKENITSINGSLNKLLTLNPVEFDWIKTGEHINAGFVAQEVEEVFPEYVVENMVNDGEEERKGLTGGMSSGIIAHLVKAIQELKAQNDALQTRIETLEQK